MAKEVKDKKIKYLIYQDEITFEKVQELINRIDEALTEYYQKFLKKTEIDRFINGEMVIISTERLNQIINKT